MRAHNTAQMTHRGGGAGSLQVALHLLCTRAGETLPALFITMK